MNSKLLALAGAIAALLFSGCAHMSQASVSATNSPVASPASSYTLKWVSAPETIDLARARESQEQLKHALLAKGLVEAAKGAPSDLLVMVDYSIGPARLHPEPHGDLVPPARGGDGRIRDNFAQMSYTTEMIATYAKNLTLTAYKNRPAQADGPSRSVWRVEVSIDDASPDLAKYAGLLVATSARYINTDSAGTKKIRVASDSI